jgi:hypothetical protein
MGQYWFLEKPLASKNRILDFARFQNYKYISNPETPFWDFWWLLAGRWSGAILACTLNE